MKQEFCFDTYEEFLKKWKEIEKSNIPKKNITIYAPHPVHGFDHLVNPKSSLLKFFTLLGALSGAISGLALTIFTVESWPIDTAGKPLISLPPFIIIGYELTILFGGVVSFLGFLLLSRMPSYKNLMSQKDYGNKYAIVIDDTKEPN